MQMQKSENMYCSELESKTAHKNVCSLTDLAK